MDKKITVVGLGPGSAGHLSLETLEVLKQGEKVILRTSVHPSVSELRRQGISFTDCDSIYEKESSFDEVYQHIVTLVLKEAAQHQVVYAVPGSPLVAERTVVMLREQAPELGVELAILPSMSFLDLAYVQLGIDPIAGLRIVDAGDFAALADAGKYPLMVTQVYSKLVAADMKIELMEVLDDEQELYFLRNLGLPDAECRKIKLYELDRQPQIDHLTSVFIPIQKTLTKEAESCIMSSDEDEWGWEDTEEYNYTDIMPLVEVIERLRAPGGCPWDREQDHSSIRHNFIEEVYEYLEAVDNKDVAGMQEELGDVLMQVVFHAQMAGESSKFSLQDVVDTVTEKLIRRHPHVFADVQADDSAAVIKNWDAIKLAEKQERTHALDGITQDLPALLRAYKLHSKASKVGFDWPDAAGVWDKVQEELAELQEAVTAGDPGAIEHELGDLLFILAGYARRLGLEGEVALNAANNRFVRRFTHVEAQVKASQKDWSDFSLEELDAFWDEAKALERMK